MARSSKLQMTFPSEVVHVDLVHTASDRISSIVGLDENDTLNLGLAVREATINAIKHGNRFDPRKNVTVTFRYSDREVEVTIEDAGGGFDPDATPDPTLPENLQRTDGRGFLLMRAFVDSVDVQPRKRGGSVVRLVKRIGKHPEPPGRPAPEQRAS